MRTIISSVCLAVCLMATVCPVIDLSAQIPAFPGAEGFGAYASGGRNGDVYHVTSLGSSASTPGTFAYGLSTAPATGRTIVFDISGYIPVSGNLAVAQNNLTIAGQTAPGDGVGIKGGTFWIEKTNVIVRHFRFRNGVSADCIDMSLRTTNVIIDHCDAMFSTDENFSSFNSPPENLTFQWSFNAWGLSPHSAGGLWYVNHATAHHTLWAHNHTRDPKALPSGLLDWVNNVTFDYGIGFIMADSTATANYTANVEGSYFICPPGNTRPYALSRAGVDSNGVPNFSLFLTNCLWDKDGDGILNGYNPGYSMVSVNPTNMIKLTNAAPRTAGIPVTQDTALVAYKKIVSQGGPLRLDANHPNGLRDEVAEELIYSLVSQRMDRFVSAADTGASNGGYGTLVSTQPPPDTDRDGMPDFWETTLGSNTAVDDHTNQVPAGAFITNNPAGYTLLEEYLHFRATPHAVLAKSLADTLTSQDVDLRVYTSGFTNKLPVVYSVSNVSTGSVTLINGYLAHFVPPTNYSGRASFDFTVTDGDGSTWTQPFLLLVSSVSVPRDLQWRGDGASNLWDTNALSFVKVGNTNLLAYREADSVTFDDVGSSSPYTQLIGTLAPSDLTVNNSSQNYTFGGAGILTGAMALIKSGSAMLTINNVNNFTGGTLIDGGTVTLGQNGRLGTGTITLSGGTLTSAYGSTSDFVLGGAVNVPADEVGTVNLSPRMAMNGLTGAGTLNLSVSGTVPEGYDRLNGSFAGFAGTLNITGTVAGAALSANYNGGGFDGNLAAAVVNLDQVNIRSRNNSTGNTLNIGALSGTTTAVIGGSTYVSNLVVSVGLLNQDSVFAGRITNGVGPTALTKNGSGSFTLSGTNTYTGATRVNAGTLVVSGALGATPVTVASGAELSGSGNLGGGIVVSNGGIISPGVGAGSIGVLTTSNGLSLTGTTLQFDLSSSPAGANDLLLVPGGMLALTNTQNFNFTLTDGVLGAGTYALIDGGAGTTSSGLAFTHNLPVGSRQTFAISSPPGQVLLNVTGTVATLTWRGTNGSSWDTTINNWGNGGAPDRFWPADAVVFDDSSTNGTVNLVGSIQPRSVVVNNASRAYVFGGDSLDGITALIKSGTGSLTLLATNNYSGGTTVSGGTLALGSNEANSRGLGTNAVTLSGGTLQIYGYGLSTTPTYGTFANDLIVNTSGVLKVPPRATIANGLTGNGTLAVVDDYVRADFTGDWSAFTGQINVGPRSGSAEFRIANSFGYGAAALFLSNGITAYPTASTATVDIGELAGAANSALGPGNGNGSNPTWRVGGKNTSATFAGSIRDAGVTTVMKVGSGAWTLSGSNTFSGGLIVSNGSVVVNGSLANCPVEVLGGATLGGNGLIAGAVAIETDGTLSPGASIGRLTISNSLTLNEGSVTFIEVNKALATNDEVICSGAVSFDGELIVTNLSGTLAPGDAFQIFQAGSASGNFFQILGSPGPWMEWSFSPTNGVLSVVGIQPPPASQYSSTVTFPGYNRAETLTNVPLLVVFGTNIPGFSYTQFYAPSAGDLRFTTTNGVTTLNHELDTWNPAGESRVWVQVPMLTSNTAIRVSWGNSTLTNPPASSTNGATWSAGYVGVWHLSDTNALDSTAGANNASSNTASVVSGLVANAASYDGVSQGTQVPWQSDFNLSANFEVQGWFKLAAADKPNSGNYRTLTSREYIDSNNRNWWLALRSDGRLQWKSSPGIDTTNNTDLANGAWHHFAAVHDGATARLYVDGLLAASDATPGLASTPTAPVFFGNENGTNRYHKGLLDEMRISNVPRSSNWVWAVYQNITSNSAFASISAVSGIVTNPPAQPTFDSFALVSGQPTFTIGGAPGYSYTIQASTNLVAWTNLVTTNPAAMPFQWTDVGYTNFSRRFYRIQISP